MIRLSFALLMLGLVSFTYGGGKEKATFTVYGNCGMCESTIEKSLADVDGVFLADWELETLEMTVKYDPDVITLDEIKQKIADAGYDTESHRATTESYEALHACCKYERP